MSKQAAVVSCGWVVILVAKKHGSIWLRMVVIFLIVAFIASMWHFSPLKQYLDSENLRMLITAVQNQWWTPLAIISAYLVANTLMFPNMVLNGAIILTMGGLLGWACAVSGSLAAASLFFYLGNRFSAGRIELFRGEKFEKVRRFLRYGGIGTVLAVRMLPVAPYSVVNTAAGTIDLRFRDFFIGTFIAHLPGTLALAFFGKQLGHLIRNPSLRNATILAAVIMLWVALALLLKRYAHRQIDKSSAST